MRTAILLTTLLLPAFSHASDLVTKPGIGLALANDIAHSGLQACKKRGYHVSVVVVDRDGLLRVALRDDLASRFTLQIAEEKANVVILSGTSSANLRKQRPDIRQELNHIDGLIMMEGGLPVTSGGRRIGAIGISGAPGGDKDEACAAEALAKFQERLEFAE